MGWDISLVKDGKVVTVSPHRLGSNTLAEVNNGVLNPIDGNEASCCITYNYAECYSIVNFSLKSINKKKAKDTIEDMSQVVKKLGTKKYRDYWAPTMGNSGYALQILLSWAKEHPEAMWEVI